MSNSLDTTSEELERIEWALGARSEIQRTLFALYKFILEKPGFLNEKVHRQAFELIVGAAFSLWRAIFLAEADRSWDSMSKSLEKFLFRIVTDNTISYQDDKTNNAWTVGYYLDNADMRLDRAWRKLLLSPTLSSDAQHASLTFSDSWELGAQHTPGQREVTYQTLGNLFKVMNPKFIVNKRFEFKAANP